MNSSFFRVKKYAYKQYEMVIFTREPTDTNTNSETPQF